MDTLISNLTGYVEAKVELIKIEVQRDVASGIAKAIAYLIIAFVFGMMLLLLSVGIALLLAERFGNFWGFGIVSAVYLITGIVLYTRREAIIRD
ncbi:MAG TPA: phage holin family protein, partial [Chryseosolibacter sp.]|nr:phage holin family protein [Chryseosolibacter sp.]